MKKRLLLFGLLLLAIIAHILTQFRVFSLFQATLSIPLLLSLVTPFPAILTACTLILFELFSSMPPGSMVLMFLIPYTVLFFWKKIRPEFSWKFFFALLGITFLQNMALIGILSIMNASAIFQIPWSIVGLQTLITAGGTFVLAFIYHEYADRL